jgi:hypothetical protein
MMSKKLLTIALVLTLGLTALYYFSPFYYFSPTQKEARFVDELVARNVAARGGAGVWQDVSSLRLSGLMDLGQEMVVPYVLEQKRPDKMCFEFVFDGETAIQCTTADGGWKLTPYLGRTTAEMMTETEYRETADTADPYGPLYNYAARGSEVDYLGSEQVDGRDTYKLKVTLSRGGVRWLYLDAGSALEVKLETMRTISGRQRRVETFYHDWQLVDGLLISRRLETQTDGFTESHFLTVDSVQVNPLLDDSRFVMPTSTGSSNGSIQKASL